MSTPECTEPVNESEAIASFLKVVNEVIRGNDCVNPMSDKTALKFLISRKFNVQRAVQLYQMHEITRLQEGLTQIDPNEDDLREELNYEKFTILKRRDANESAIAIFTAKLHSPNRSSKNPAVKKKIHRVTLQGIVYQLDAALEDLTTQRNGLVFIYNMIDSEYSNFDYELCQKILNLLKGAYPAKLKKVLIVSAPAWFKVPFHLLRLIVREKLRDRVSLLNTEQIKEHIPIDALPKELGGTYQHNHQNWINECNTIYKTKFDDICDPASAKTLVKSMSSNKSSSRRQSIEKTLGFGNEDLCAQINDAILMSPDGHDGAKRFKSSLYDYDETGQSLSQLVSQIREQGRKGLGDTYDAIVRSEKTGTFRVSTNPINMRKNRYINVVCYDHTRVVLEPYDLPDGISLSDPMDYINASFVDGYRQPRAYISTQGPIGPTFMDFWRMIWQTCCRVIVMVTQEFENGVMKCDKYWPTSANRVLTLGIYKIEYITIESNEDYIVTSLKLTNTRSKVSRDISHLQFTSWPDFGVPSNASALLKFRECVLKKQLDAIECTGSATYPPITVHCSAGVGRSGTFVTIDICIQRLETTGLVDVKNAVEKLRQQRYCSIQTRDQFIFCYKAVIEYATSCGLLQEKDLNGLFDTF